jgi:hypothetical protein
MRQHQESWTSDWYREVSRVSRTHMCEDFPMRSVVAIMFAVFISACGGGNGDRVAQASEVRERSGALAALSEPVDQVEILYTFNFLKDDQIGGWQSLRRVATALDANNIRFSVSECGVYGSDPISGETGGYIWPPIGVLVRVSQVDASSAVALGGQRGVPAGKYIRDPRMCGDVNQALAPSRRLFAWASRTYSSLFPEYTDAVFLYENYEYAYFPQTGNYIGIKDGSVFVHNGREWNFLNVGFIADFIPSVLP